MIQCRCYISNISVKVILPSSYVARDNWLSVQHTKNWSINDFNMFLRLFAQALKKQFLTHL